MSRLSSFSIGFSLIVFLSVGAWAENSEHVRQARDTGSCPSCDLSSAYLKGLQAEQGNFSYANLQGANLTYSMLAGAYIAGADLTGVDLSGADLTGADFSGANLTLAITNEFTTCPDGGSGPCQF